MAAKNKPARKPIVRAADAKPRDPSVSSSREQKPCEDKGKAMARAFLRPNIGAAITIQGFAGMFKDTDFLDIVDALKDQINTVNDGDLKCAEEMLLVQAYSLDALFNRLVQLAGGQEHLKQYEAHFRLGLKAQAQCAHTLEVLAAIKNPQSIAFVRQANIAAGPQQVNNGVARAEKLKSEPSKLLEADNGERMDTPTEAAPSKDNPQLETVGAIDRTANTGR